MKKYLYIIVGLFVIVFVLWIIISADAAKNDFTEQKEKAAQVSSNIRNDVKVDTADALEIVNRIRLYEEEKVDYWKSESINGNETYLFASDKAIYRIDSESGNVMSVILFDYQAAQFTVSMEEAQVIAVKSIEKYRPDYDIEKSTLVERDRFESQNQFRYDFEWRYIENEVDMGNICAVSVSGNGQMISFACHMNRDSAFDSDAVKVTKEEAENIALKKIAISESREYIVDDSHLQLFNGITKWIVKISSVSTDDPMDEERFYMVEINAVDGSILSVNAG